MKSSWKVYVGLGANLGDPAGQLRAALASLQSEPSLTLRATSSFWRSLAVGPGPQSDYCNAVCSLVSELSPPRMLRLLMEIERRAGRVRGERWGPRVLDLDLLHVEGECSDSEELTLPHPQIANRPFVLVPLAEVEPDLLIPGVGSVAELASTCDRHGLRLWSADPESA